MCIRIYSCLHALSMYMCTYIKYIIEQVQQDWKYKKMECQEQQIAVLHKAFARLLM